MELVAIFNRLGLPEKAADLYLAALELGTASASALAQKSGIQRTYFYELAGSLVQYGLLRETFEGKRRRFVAVSPDHIAELFKEQYKVVQTILPELKAHQNTQGSKPKVYFYAGREGIEEINQDTLRYHGEMVAFTTPRFVSAQKGRVAKEYIKKRVAQKNKVRVVGPDSTEIRALQEKDWKELRDTRALPKELFDSNVEIGMYGNKVFIVDYKSSYGMVIESSEVSKTLKQVFEIVWDKAKAQSD